MTLQSAYSITGPPAWSVSEICDTTARKIFRPRTMVKAGGLIEEMESPDWLIDCPMEEVESEFYFIIYFKLIPSKPFMVQTVSGYYHTLMSYDIQQYCSA